MSFFRAAQTEVDSIDSVFHFISDFLQDGIGDKVLGWSLRGRYDQYYLYDGLTFNDEDDEMLQALREVNKQLPKEQQFSFYVFKIESNASTGTYA